MFLSTLQMVYIQYTPHQRTKYEYSTYRRGYTLHAYSTCSYSRTITSHILYVQQLEYTSIHPTRSFDVYNLSQPRRHVFFFLLIVCMYMYLAHVQYCCVDMQLRTSGFEMCCFSGETRTCTVLEIIACLRHSYIAS